MLRRTKYGHIHNATSSPESAGGPTHSGLQDGQTTDLSGQEAAPASLSARQAKEAGMLTSGTYGPHGSTLSRSVDLTLFLANRLKRRLDTAGLTLFKMTWKEKATPSGRLLYRLAASGRRISGSDCGSWPTPVANDDNKSPEAHLAMKGRMGGGRKEITSLQVMAKTIWPTPCQQDGPNGGPNQGEDILPGAASLTGWATPGARDWKDSPGMSEKGVNPDGSERSRLDQLPRQAGLISNGSPAGTEKPGQLNPAFSLWLMGYPTEWARCAARVTRSSRKSPRK